MDRRSILKAMAASIGGVALAPPLGSASSHLRVSLTHVSAEAAFSRYILELDRRAGHNLFTLDQPERVVLDLFHAGRWRGPRPDASRDRFVQRVRTGNPQSDVYRVVFDLTGPARARVSPIEGVGDRRLLMVEIFPGPPPPLFDPRVLDGAPSELASTGSELAGSEEPTRPIEPESEPEPEPEERVATGRHTAGAEPDPAPALPESSSAESAPGTVPNRPSVEPRARERMEREEAFAEGRGSSYPTGAGRSASVSSSDYGPDPAPPHAPETGERREIVVLIDPGHGGRDPGALGSGGLLEKQVTLDVGLKLANRFAATPGYQVWLTRDRDYYLSIENRLYMVDKLNPDFFLSLHADAFPDDVTVGGAAVFCPSGRCPTDPRRILVTDLWRGEAAFAAALANAAPSRACPPDPEAVGGEGRPLGSGDVGSSLVLGRKILDSLVRTPQLRVHGRAIRQANFNILSTPTTPSVLVEMAFLTNPEDEARVQREGYQKALAEAVFHGANRFGAARRVRG